jgi:hypothetical protein
MRRLIILTPAFVFVAACGDAPLKQQSATERSAEPERLHGESGARGDSVPSQ